MNNILPEQVIQAYNETGLLPGFGTWAIKPLKLENCYACGLTALLVATGKMTFDEASQSQKKGDMYNTVSKALGLPYEYIKGFACGYDKDLDSLIESTEDQFKKGYLDGKSAHQKVSESYRLEEF